MKPWAGSRKARRMARRRERNQGTSQRRAKGECEPGDHQAPQSSPRRQGLSDSGGGSPANARGSCLGQLVFALDLAI